MSKSISAEQFVESFFKDQGIGHPKKVDTFWKQLEKKFGNQARQFHDIVSAREQGDSVDPYSLKNQSLAFTNAIAAQFDRAKLKAMAVWLMNEYHQKPPTRVLEVGCDNGLLTCLIACLFPKAEIIGIDPDENGIKIATERATNSGISNLRFECRKVEALEGYGQFDLIIAVAVFHEILLDGLAESALEEFRNSLVDFSIEQTEALINTDCESNRSIESVVQCVKKNGRFVSADRWTSPGALLWWIRKVERSGMSISLNESHILEYKDMDGHQQLPLSQFTDEKHNSPTATEVLSFFGYQTFFGELTQVMDIQDPVLAEMMFSAFGSVKLIWKVTVIYKDDSGTEEITLGYKNALGFLYTTTNLGFRRLALFPVVCVPEHLMAWQDIKSDKSRVGNVAVEFSDDTDVLNRLGVQLEKSE